MSILEETSISKGPLVVRLTSSRSPASTPSGHRDLRARSSGVNDQSCFGDEWFDDAEEEAELHQMMDAFETSRGDVNDSGGGTEMSATSERCEKAAITNTTCNMDINLSDNIQSCLRCCCESASEIENAPGTSSSKSTDEQRTVHSETEIENKTETICSHCNKPILGTSGSESKQNIENEIETNQSTEGEVIKAKSNKASDKSSPKTSSDDNYSAGEIPSSMTPMRQFKGSYLWVSDLTAQAWCERQLLYDFTFEGPVEILETPAMKVGTEMHLKRELEVHVIKQIKVSTKEDKWAVKLLNIISSINQLLQGGGGGASRCVIREMPIFGRPFQTGAFVTGVIDEIRYNVRDKLEVVEFKTRAKARTVPSQAQRKIHKLQVMLYKQLFDEAVCGQISKQTILDTIRLDPEATINDEIAAHALKLGLELAKFGDYLDAALDRFQFLPKIDSLAVEYSSQDDKSPFAVLDFPFDPVWLRDRLEFYNAFWEGRREVEGVDVEDAWKCNYCNYVDECDWRKKMHEKLVNRNAAKRVKIEMTK